MDGLSGVASGFAVASLSIQLVESVSKIITFIRNVKNAPSEVVRLAELLKYLCAFLEDVRNVLERQTSLHGQHFPMPSMTIFTFLKGCEDSLRPIQDTIERYERSKGQRDSSLTLMKGNIKFGMKAKDITSFETRIQQNIQYLTGSLVLNNTSIAMQAPAFLNTRTQTSVILNVNPPEDLTSFPQSIYQDEPGPLVTSTVKYSRRISWIPSRFERFGLRQQKFVKSVYSSEEQTEQMMNRSKEPCMEEYINFWTPRFLGRGVSWRKQYPYGQITPSLRVYPIVKNFHSSLPFKIETVGILELQRMFTSNIVHPFIRNEGGHSLFHEAAFYHRSDICQLIQGYGVRPDLSMYNLSPLWLAMNVGHDSTDRRFSNPIETFRILLEDSNLVDDFTDWNSNGESTLGEELEWMWKEGLNILYGEDLLNFHCVLLRNQISCSSAVKNPKVYPELRHWIESGYGGLLTSLFSIGNDALRSYQLGTAFMVLLRQLQINLELCISNELNKLPRRVLSSENHFDKKISFEHNDKLGWILGWEWQCNPESPVFQLFSECTVWTEEKYKWPFHEIDWGSAKDKSRLRRKNAKWVARDSRRAANKARKERARTGQKRPRIMPGAWM